jgi:predicted ester cyclase
MLESLETKTRTMNTELDDRTVAPGNLAQEARGALERVCSGAGLDPPSRYYGPTFVDHVNDLEFHGLEGAEKSVAIYRKTFSELSIRVEEQSADGNRVTSRFVVEGTCLGRRVRFNGITISRFEGGLIVEDWTVTDTLGMLRQLGLLRSLAVGLQSWRVLSSATAHSDAHAQNSSACART